MTGLAPSDRDVVADEGWRLSPATLLTEISPGHIPPKHLLLAAWFLKAVQRGAIRRLAVALPPGHAKSSLVSWAFPTWLFDWDPSQQLILASYEASRAVHWSAKVRDTLRDKQLGLHAEVGAGSEARNEWFTTAGGRMLAAGLNGPITGVRAHGLIVDDPIKNAEEASSITMRDRAWSNYESAALTRLFPTGWIVVIQTRWAEDDLVGRLIRRQAHDDVRWVYVRLPAVATEHETIDTVIGKDTAEWLRARGERLPAWERAEGEPLWPTVFNVEQYREDPYYDAKWVAEKRSESDHHTWETVYQQNPTVPGGDMFPEIQWGRANAVPAGCRFARGWDLAGTAGAGDWTVGALIAVHPTRGVTVVDVVRGQWDGAGVLATMRATAERDHERLGAGVVIQVVEQEPGSSGRAWVSQIIRELAPYPVVSIPPSGNKTERARGFAAQQQNGNVALLRRTDGALWGPAPWWDAFVQELSAFPTGENDDQCFPATTLVMTPNGPAPIAAIRQGDTVLGASGWVTVQAAAQTGTRPVYEAWGLRATADHPIATTRGWVPFLNVKHDDTLWICDALRTAVTARPSPAGSVCGATSDAGAIPKVLNQDRRSQMVASSPVAALAGSSSEACAPSTTRAGRSMAIHWFSEPPNAGACTSYPLNSTASPFAATPIPQAPLTVGTTSRAGSGSSEESRRSTKRSGRPPMGQSLLAGTSITRTATGMTTASRTSTAFPQGITPGNIRSSVPYEQVLLPKSFTLRGSVHWPRRGIGHPRAASGIGTTSSGSGRIVGLVQPVYNLTTSDGTYFADGVLVHNCDAIVYAFNHLMLTKTPGRAGVATPASSRKRIVAPAPQGVS